MAMALAQAGDRGLRAPRDQVEPICGVLAVFALVGGVVVGAPLGGILVTIDQVVEDDGEGADRGAVGGVDQLGLGRGRSRVGRGGDQRVGRDRGAGARRDLPPAICLPGS